MSFCQKVTSADQQARIRQKTFSDDVMLRLGQRSTDRDVWLWVPRGTTHN
jgi:hypothetical protein